MSKRAFLLLFLVFVIASVLRLWQLGTIPPSPDWDEAALGYNAYSLMLTGKDEYGVTLPVVLRSFDDYKPALYAYISIPFIKYFGLTTAGVRFPSALAGIFTVLLTFFLVKELLGLSTYKGIKNEYIALLAAFLLAISPWHIQFSRIAFESNVGVALNIAALFVFLKGLQKPWYLILASVLMGLNLYMYQSEKVFTPLMVIMLIILYRKELFTLPKKYLLIACVVSIVVIFPLIIFTATNKNALARAKGVSVFSEQTAVLAQDSKRLVRDRENNDFIGLIFDNRRMSYAKSIVGGYLSHFDLNWLFITGDLARHHAPNMGLMYFWELPFLLVGVYMLIFGKFSKKFKMLVFLWILIVPIPASVTTGVPHAVRTLNVLPFLQVLVAIGFIAAASFFCRNKFHFKIFLFVYGVIIIFSICYYLNQYFVQQNYINSEEWQYGYQQVVSYIKHNQNYYRKVVVSNQPYLDQSYIFFLFYLQYPPSLYQSETRNASGGFRENHLFGKFEFRSIKWEKETRSSDIIYVGRPVDFSSNNKKVYSVSFLDGKEGIVLAQ